MRKSSIFFFFVTVMVFTGSSVYGQQDGRAFFDFGVFAYEDGDYPNAEANFKRAIDLSPSNPTYFHYLGKTYLKMDRLQEALDRFSAAKKMDPNLAGLDYDIAYIYYKMGDYQKAAELFMGIARAAPSNVMASYYSGISLLNLNRHKEALGYFLEASEKSPTITVNGRYYAGVCYHGVGDTEKSIEAFEYVRSNAVTESLKESAVKWLEKLAEEKKAKKPYSIYVKLGGQYDDNVRLEPLDIDLYSDRDDVAMIGHVIGAYNFVNQKNFILSAAYSHYQAAYAELDEYNLVGSTGTLFAAWRQHPITLGLGYLPSYYWVDAESFLRQHQIRPEIMLQISDRLFGRLSYSYIDKDYLDEEERSGHSNDGFLDFFYSTPNNKVQFFGGGGYLNNDASHPDHDYGEIRTKVGCSLKAPWQTLVTVTAKYETRAYENEDSLYDEKREDDEYSGILSILRPVYYEWLNLLAEYQYTKAFSNIDSYEFDQNVITLSLTLSY